MDRRHGSGSQDGRHPDPATAFVDPFTASPTLSLTCDVYDWLTAGGVFTEDFIQTWIDLKRSGEVDPVKLRPHPYEFSLYYDI